MKRLPHFAGLGFAFCLTACAPSLNGTVFEADDAREGDYIAKEYGDTQPETVPVLIDGVSYDFKVRSARIHQRVLIEGTSAATAATTRPLSRMTMGVVVQNLNDTPYRDAALRHLANSGKSGCKLKIGGQLQQHFEWNYECDPTASRQDAQKK